MINLENPEFKYRFSRFMGIFYVIPDLNSRIG